jgi:hypothetical protein
VGSYYGIVITDLVMTLAKLSTTHKYTVRPRTKGIDNKERVHSPAAHDPDGPDIWRVLKTSYASRVGCRITTPVTKKTEYLWFKFVICHSSPCKGPYLAQDLFIGKPAHRY